MAKDPTQQPGGFIPPTTGLPSPSPSVASSSRTAPGGSLPHPRAAALHPGSSKEDMVRRYVEDRLLYTSRRYVKKFGNPDPKDTVVGFKSFGEVCKELDGIVNVLWLSGTSKFIYPIHQTHKSLKKFFISFHWRFCFVFNYGH